MSDGVESEKNRLSRPLEDEGETLAEQLFCHISEAIISGDLPPGAKVSEPALARQYSVSRGPVREVMHRLLERRLVVRVPNHGVRVVTPSRETLLELFVVREALEGIAAREAVLNGTADEVRAIRAIHDTYLQKLDLAVEPPPYIHGSVDQDFHFLIAQATHNPFLIKLLCSDLNLLLRFYRARVRYVAGRVPRIVVEHARILDAIEERDPDMAELYMRRHVRTASQGLAALFTDQTASS